MRPQASAAQGAAVRLLDPGATSTMEATTFVDMSSAGSVVSAAGAVPDRLDGSVKPALFVRGGVPSVGCRSRQTGGPRKRP